MRTTTARFLLCSGGGVGADGVFIALSLWPNSAASFLIDALYSLFAMIAWQAPGLIFEPLCTFWSNSCPNWRCIGIVMVF
jgi:hypothetical protein